MSNTTWNEYRLAGSHNLTELMQIVNEWVQAGWQPIGGPFTIKLDEIMVAYQAMVR